MTVYSVSGPTLILSGDGSDQAGTLLAANCIDPITGARGPIIVKISNSSPTDVAYIEWGDGNVPTYTFEGVSGTASGSGVNATFDVTVDETGYAVIIDDAGTGYIPTETIVILGTDLGGATTTNDATVTVLTANVLNEVATLDDTTLVPGTGYSDASGVATTGGTGTGLTVDITQTAGAIDTVAIADGGEDYTVGDTITITGGNADATIEVLTVTPGGEILTVSIAGTALYPQEAIQQTYVMPLSTEFVQVNPTNAVVDSFFIGNSNSGDMYITPVNIVS